MSVSAEPRLISLRWPPVPSQDMLKTCFGDVVKKKNQEWFYTCFVLHAILQKLMIPRGPFYKARLRFTRATIDHEAGCSNEAT